MEGRIHSRSRRSSGGTVALAAAMLALAAGCVQSGEITGSGDDSSLLDVDVLDLEADHIAASQIQTLSDMPVDAEVFQGWYAADPHRDPPSQADPRSPEADAQPPPEPGKSYLAATVPVGCRSADDVELSRERDDLRVELTGGTQHDNCGDPLDPYVHLEVDSDAVDGVTTINDEPLLDPHGPGQLHAFEYVGAGVFDAGDVPQPQWLEDGAAEELADTLAAADADNLDEVSLEDSDSSQPRAAFVLRGCGHQSAVLVVTATVISAELAEASGEHECEVPQQYLAVFDIDADRVPAEAMLDVDAAHS